MEKTRFIRVVRIAVEHYEDAETIVNQSIRQLRENGAKIISIQVLGIPFLMYNIIYEAEAEISATAEQKEQKEPETAICTESKSEDNAETTNKNTEQESGEQHGEENT